MEERYYIITAKCGHVGSGKFIRKNLTLIAANRKDAAAIGRKLPRVKHDWSDAIEDVREVSMEEYFKQRIKNYADPYFSVGNIQEQRLYCSDIHNNVIKVEKEERSPVKRVRRINYLLKRRKIEEAQAWEY